MAALSEQLSDMAPQPAVQPAMWEGGWPQTISEFERVVEVFRVPCKVEVEKDGVRSIESYEPGIRAVHGQPDRWTIHGGI